MILLINPKTCKNNQEVTECIREPNLGILYLAAILDQNEIPVDILDLEQYYSIPDINIYELIKKSIADYSIIGITCLTNTFHLAIRIAEFIKFEDSNKLVILGGPHVTFQYKEILRKYGSNRKKIVDFICVGESEKSFLSLSKVLLSLSDINYNFYQMIKKIKPIKGIAYSDEEDNVIFTGYSNNLVDIESLPLPARYKLSQETYYYSVANILVNRGCPNRCSFCVRQELFQNKVRLRSIKSIESEIRDILSMQTYDYINFYDNINISETFLIDFCKMFLENQFRIPWGCELRVDNLTEEQIKLLKKAGCKLVATGIESASKKVLNINFKYQDPRQVKEGVALLKKHQIPVQAYFVLGLPGENADTFNETIEFIKALTLSEKDTINYFVATPYPGSKLWDQAEKFDLTIFENDFRNYDCEHLIFETKELKKKTLKEMLLIGKKIEACYSKNKKNIT